MILLSQGEKGQNLSSFPWYQSTRELPKPLSRVTGESQMFGSLKVKTCKSIRQGFLGGSEINRDLVTDWK